MYKNIIYRFLPKGKSPRRVLFGALKNLRLYLDPQVDIHYWLGIYELEIQGWLEKFCHEADTIFDIGSNRGMLTSFFGFSRTAKAVEAFEPQAAMHDDILGNWKLNAPLRKTPAPTLALHPERVSNSGIAGSIALDSFVEQLSPDETCFLKIDVDGYEMEVLESARELLSLPNVVIILETHSKALENACISFLTSAGFKTRVISRYWWRRFITEGRSLAHNQWLIASK